MSDIPNKLVGKLLDIFNASAGGVTSVGLSIGSSSIKIVELKKSGKSWKLLHFGIVQLPEDVIVDRDISNSITVTESVKTLVSQIKLSNKSVCIGISGPSVLVKRMMLEIPNQKEIQDQIFWEAEQYLPFDSADAVMDYQILSQGKDARIDLLFVATKRSTLDGYITCIEDAGLRPKIVDLDFFAIQNTYEASYPPNHSEAVALVDLGASSIKIVVVQAGVPIFTKDSVGADLGGRALTQAIQKNLNLSYADAESLKIGSSTVNAAAPMPAEVRDLIHAKSSVFANEIKKTLDFYNVSSIGAPISYVLLCGGTSKISGFSRIVEECVGLPTQMINPFNAITYDAAVFSQEYLLDIAPMASVPIGLAIRAGGQ